MSNTKFYVYIEVSSIKDSAESIDRVRDVFSGVVMNMQSDAHEFYDPQKIIEELEFDEIGATLSYGLLSRETANIYLKQFQLALGKNSSLRTGVIEKAPQLAN